MSAATIASSPGRVDQLFLRWSDSPELPLREEPVELIGSHSSESVIRSALKISEKTKVYLIGKHYTGNGVVRSCHRQGSSFLLTIFITSESSGPEFLPEYDPGIFAVDGFLTEEEESKILGALDLDDNICKVSNCISEKIRCSLRQFLASLTRILHTSVNARIHASIIVQFDRL